MTSSDDDFDTDERTRQLLRALDPARSLPHADAHALASLLEDTMSQTHTAQHPRRVGPRAAVLLACAVGAALLLAVAALVSDGDDQPTAKQTVTTLDVGPALATKCMAPSADLVARQAIAFEGTVITVTDDLVTLAASHFYHGNATDLVTVSKPDLGMSELPVDFQVGKAYLVGATDGHVSICGLSGPAADELRALYTEAFGK